MQQNLLLPQAKNMQNFNKIKFKVFFNPTEVLTNQRVVNVKQNLRMVFGIGKIVRLHPNMPGNFKI
jgi:hypothetical protein